MKENNIDINNVVIHAPYIVNLANNKEPEKWDFAIKFLKEEISRSQVFGVNKIVLHPGSHVGLGTEVAIQNIANALNIILKGEGPSILLETMAGKGSEVGKTFEEIKAIIDKVENKQRIKVCLDTCHINDAGYDVKNFDKLIIAFSGVLISCDILAKNLFLTSTADSVASIDSCIICIFSKSRSFS